MDKSRSPGLECLEMRMHGRSFSEHFDQFMIQSSRRRRASVRAVERLFFDLAASATHILEAGANDGTHTKQFLETCSGTIHAFEPNPNLHSSLSALPRGERLNLSTAALGNISGVARKLAISDVSSGISTLHSHRLHLPDMVVLVPVIRADSYLNDYAHDGDIAAWIDVEGGADQVIEGFGDQLARVQVMLVEVETKDYYGRIPSLESVLTLLEAAGLQTIARDWMNDGQFNLLATRIHPANSSSYRFYTDMMRECMTAYDGDPQHDVS